MDQLNTDEKVKLPSRFQVGDHIGVILNDQTKFGGYVTTVHFTESKVKYDIAVVVNSYSNPPDVNDTVEEILLKTRLYNIDSAFVVSKAELHNSY